MRYKIINIPERHNEEVYDRFFVMKEVKKWYHKEPKWKHVHEHGYSGRYKVSFRDLNKAEKYIKDMIKSDNTDMTPKEVKVYDTRESAINNLLENE
jgi:hypothetical protein